jgi:hypothetical protein
MAAIEDVREVADALVSIFRNTHDRWRDISGATRIERCELLWDSHLAQDFKDRSITETVYVPVPRFQQRLWAVIDGRYAGSNRRDKPLPAMEEITESPPVHNVHFNASGKPEEQTFTGFCELELGLRPYCFGTGTSGPEPISFRTAFTISVSFSRSSFNPRA